MKWEIDELVRNVKEKNNNEENNCYTDEKINGGQRMDRKTMNGLMTTDRQIKKRTMGGLITIFRHQMDIAMDRATMDGQTSDNG